MKHQWHDIVKDYLTFTRKDRVAIVILLCFAAFISCYTMFVKPLPELPADTAFQKQISELTILVDSTPERTYANENFEPSFRERPYTRPAASEIFYFDPNTIDGSAWQRLGVRPRTIATIQKFMGKGFKFRTPEDLGKIYGLHPNEVARLMPYVRIKQQPYANLGAGNSLGYSTPVNNEVSLKKEITRRIIDVNTADSNALIALPGIGNKLASRIINFRQKLGGFATVSQVAETYGLPDSTFKAISARLSCSPNGVQKININSAEAAQLKSHPYIRWELANAIVNYRKQHGDYNSINDLKNIVLVTDELYNRIIPYLSVSAQTQ